MQFIGSYKDTGSRALRYGPHAYGYTAETCAAACPQYTYIGLQDNGWCCCDNDYNHVTKYGTASNCYPKGAGWCNAVYKKVEGQPSWSIMRDLTSLSQCRGICRGGSIQSDLIADNAANINAVRGIIDPVKSNGLYFWVGTGCVRIRKSDGFRDTTCSSAERALCVCQKTKKNTFGQQPQQMHVLIQEIKHYLRNLKHQNMVILKVLELQRNQVHLNVKFNLEIMVIIMHYGDVLQVNMVYI